MFTSQYRVFGASDGLLVSLKVFQNDLDYLCGGSVDGFKVCEVTFCLEHFEKIISLSCFFIRRMKYRK